VDRPGAAGGTVNEEAPVDGLARSMRLVTGLGMVAAGSSLAAPAGIQLAVWCQARQAAVMQQAPPAAVPGSLSGVTSPAVDVPGGWAVDQPPPGGSIRSEYVPPPPPSPLPAAPAALAAVGPDLASHYRTTLAVPPPPLLDGQRPPPLAVGWTARGAGVATAFPRPAAPPPAASYRVRDGDDLTAIAIRFYGTPAAAAAIWQANQGILRDPGLLPIGVDLALPPPEAIGIGSGHQRSIEPSVAGPAVSQPGLPAVTASWLKRD